MAEEQNKGDKPDLQPAARPFPLISYLFSAAQMSQFKPDSIKGRVIGKLLSGQFTLHKD